MKKSAIISIIIISACSTLMFAHVESGLENVHDKPLEVVLEEIVAASVAIDVHLSRVPFATKGRHAIRAPVDENAELGILVPLRNLIGL